MRETFIPADVAVSQTETLPTERTLMGQESIRETMAFLGIGKPKIVTISRMTSSGGIVYEEAIEVKGALKFGKVDAGWKPHGESIEATQSNPHPDNRATRYDFYREKTYIPVKK